MKGPKPKTNEERFWPKVDKSPNCWRYIGATKFWVQNGNRYGGYGAFGLYAEGEKGHKPVYAHRYAWELAHGPIPEGMRILHRCDNPPCVKTEPDDQYPEGHLYLGTAKDNSQDMTAKGRHGRVNHPEAWASAIGDNHWTRQHPERLLYGDANALSRAGRDRRRTNTKDEWVKEDE